MDAAALSLKVDSSSVVQAANDLDRFSVASARAAKASAGIGNASGSIAKLVASVQSADQKLSAIVSGLDKVNTALSSMAKAGQGAAAANDNVARAVGAADAHVIAYTQHLASLARAQQDANAHVVAYRANLAASVATGQQADAHVLAYRNSLNQVEEGARKASTAIKFTAQDSLNASRQLADIGVTAASGMSPFLIAIQQGPQLLDILQNKAATTGASLGTVFRAAASSVLAFLAPFLPLIALLALAAAGIAAMTAQANDDSGLKKYTTAMGYTKAEVAKLNAVTVTFGDTTRAVFQVGGQRIAEAWGLNAKQIKDTWSNAMDFLASATRATLAGIYASLAVAGKLANPAGAVGLIAKGKGNLFSGIKSEFKEDYGSAQGFLGDVVKQARKNAQGRQDEMAKAFYDKPSTPKTPKGPKPFTYDDLMKDADKIRDGLNKQAAQIGLYGEALAKAGFEADLLNKASERGLKLSPAQKTAVAGIAAELAKLAEANRHATFMEEFAQQTGQQVRSLEQQRGAIGLTAGALAAYTYEQDQLNKAISQHITLTDADRQKIADDANRIGQETTRNTTDKARDDGYRLHNEQMRQLEVERDALNLTGVALISYNYQQAEITRQRQAGVQAADINVDAIRREGDAYALQRDALDKQRQAIADSREITRGFFSDFINGARQGGNVFKAFADSLINSLNKIISKLADRALDSLFGGSSSGGFLASILGGSGSTARASADIAARSQAGLRSVGFAKGGVFTNTVVNTPTLFRFANGGALGEMGEAGPEAIMPLKRGPNGALGVQMHGGGRPSVRMGDIHNTFEVSGALDQSQIVAMIRQGGAATYDQVKRDLQSLLATLDNDGGFAT